MKIVTTWRYDKQYARADAKIQMKVDDTLIHFIQDPLHKSLRNHALKWKLLWFRSINVTWDWRIIFKEMSDNKYELVELVDLGTHSRLY